MNAVGSGGLPPLNLPLSTLNGKDIERGLTSLSYLRFACLSYSN